jgi:hypothetical protein
MGLLLYGGLGLLPIWLMIGYAWLGQPHLDGPSQALLWISVGAVPACFMTLAFAEAIMVRRERRPDPWRQHKIVLIVLPMALLLFASGVTWEEQDAARRDEQDRILRLVAADPGVVAWVGAEAQAQITLTLPNPDVLGAPLRYWVTAESGRRRLHAVVDADRRVTPSPLTLVCVRRDVGPVVREAPPLNCRR